ncbi:hypothetical protein KRM28CT15_17550 [Krasilnikovia sp. M28-CT-15]
MRPADGRLWVGASVAAAPHALILALMTVGILYAEGIDRAYVGYLGLLEIYIVPLALLAAAGVTFVPRLRRWAAGIVGSTLAGAVVVTLATLVIGNAATWS